MLSYGAKCPFYSVSGNKTMLEQTELTRPKYPRTFTEIDGFEDIYLFTFWTLDNFVHCKISNIILMQTENGESFKPLVGEVLLVTWSEEGKFKESMINFYCSVLNTSKLLKLIDSSKKYLSDYLSDTIKSAVN